MEQKTFRTLLIGIVLGSLIFGGGVVGVFGKTLWKLYKTGQIVTEKTYSKQERAGTSRTSQGLSVASNALCLGTFTKRL